MAFRAINKIPSYLNLKKLGEAIFITINNLYIYRKNYRKIY